MKNILLNLFILTILFALAKEALAMDVVTGCQKKDSELTCADLGYNDELNSGLHCTRCPLLTEDKYSCVAQGSAVDIRDIIPGDVSVINRTPKVCEELPTCSTMGYKIRKEDMKKIPTTYSCSACPFDGNFWACAGTGKLIRLQAH